ncbi:hypothetical protein SLA2020_441530 [Shorea laevis]
MIGGCRSTRLCPARVLSPLNAPPRAASRTAILIPALDVSLPTTTRRFLQPSTDEIADPGSYSADLLPCHKHTPPRAAPASSLQLSSPRST